VNILLNFMDSIGMLMVWTLKVMVYEKYNTCGVKCD